MSRLLFCWELGAGLGHIAPHLPAIERLMAHGHEVWFALRNLERAETVLGSRGIRYLQAPTRLHACPAPIQPLTSYPQMLHNVGYYDRDVLLGRLNAWRALLGLLDPDLVVGDHAPTALLAARIGGRPRAMTGNGFMVPPPTRPLPHLVELESGRNLADDERRVVEVVNASLGRLGVDRIEWLADLFEQVPAVLTTFRELDPYPSRPAARYYPSDPVRVGRPPVWPEVAGTRVFAHLKPGRYLEPLLQTLERLGLPTLLVADGIPAPLLERHSGRTIAVADGLLDLAAVRKACDLAITNGSHGTSASLLLGGRPLLMLPLHLEHQIVAERIAGLGAGQVAMTADPAALTTALKALIEQPHHRESAARFAASYRETDFDDLIVQQVAVYESLLA